MFFGASFPILAHARESEYTNHVIEVAFLQFPIDYAFSEQVILRLLHVQVATHPVYETHIVVVTQVASVLTALHYVDTRP